MGTHYLVPDSAVLSEHIRLRVVDEDGAGVAGLTIGCVVRNDGGTSVSTGNCQDLGSGWYTTHAGAEAVSSPLTVEYSPPAGYQADADTVAVDYAARVDLRLPASPAAVSDVPSAATNAGAVRVNLATELGRIDAAVSSRLASASYTAPDNATLTTVAANVALIRSITAGNWRIDAEAHQLILTAEDGMTEVARFDLFDGDGAPNAETVLERRRTT